MIRQSNSTDMQRGMPIHGLQTESDSSIDLSDTEIEVTPHRALIGQRVVGRLTKSYAKSKGRFVLWHHSRTMGVLVSNDVLTTTFGREPEAGEYVECTIEGFGPSWAPMDRRHPYSREVKPVGKAEFDRAWKSGLSRRRFETGTFQVRRRLTVPGTSPTGSKPTSPRQLGKSPWHKKQPSPGRSTWPGAFKDPFKSPGARPKLTSPKWGKSMLWSSKRVSSVGGLRVTSPNKPPRSPVTKKWSIWTKSPAEWLDCPSRLAGLRNQPSPSCDSNSGKRFGFAKTI